MILGSTTLGSVALGGNIGAVSDTPVFDTTKFPYCPQEQSPYLKMSKPTQDQSNYPYTPKVHGC